MLISDAASVKVAQVEMCTRLQKSWRECKGRLL